MKKFIVFLLSAFFIINIYSQSGKSKGDIWLHLLTAQNKTCNLGDKLGFWIDMEIGQASWSFSDIGYGKSNTDPASWTWLPAEWFEDGTLPNKRVHTYIVLPAALGTGDVYYAGRAKAELADAWHYANNEIWGNAVNFAPIYKITVNPLPKPTLCTASPIGTSQIKLSWKADNNYKSIIIIAKKASEPTSDPIQGKEYRVNDICGDAVVVYKGSYDNFIHNSLEKNQHYYYRFYTDNNNYYSLFDVSSKADAVTLSVPACSFNINLGKDTSICGFGTVNLKTGLSISPFNDSLKITYDATKGITKLKGASKVYMHSGVELHKFGGWQYVVGNWGKDDGVGQMKKAGTDLWTITIHPQSYFNYSSDSSIYGLFLVFRNQDTLKGKDDSDNDIWVNMAVSPPYSYFNGVTAVELESPYNAIKWSDGSSNPEFNVSVKGTYSVLVTDNKGCEGRDTININISAIPDINLGKDSTLCKGNEITLSPGQGFKSYLWSDNSTGATLKTTQAGTYSVTVTNDAGCKGYDFINIKTEDPPVIKLGKDTAICEGSVFILNAGVGYKTYLWSDNSTKQDLQVTDSGTYSVTVTTKSGCEGYGSIKIETIQIPEVNLGKDTLLCKGSSLTLDAGEGFDSYLWSDNSTGSKLVVFNGGQYVLTVSKANCLFSDTINIQLAESPALNLGNDTTFCKGNTLTLKAQEGYKTYLWSDNSTNSSLDISGSGVYKLTVTDDYGCSAIDSLSVNLIDYADANFSVESIDNLVVYIKDLSKNAENYFWDFDGDNQTDLTTKGDVNYTYKEAGQYYISLKVENQCFSDVFNKLVLINSIKEKTKDSFFTIYPNPASDFLNIKINTILPGKIYINIFDLSGKLNVLHFESVKLVNNNISLDISSLSAGDYIIEILSYKGDNTKNYNSRDLLPFKLIK
ncbi:MAG: T9SS type A sorting domain-containing protein [Bacteroidales bacterium]|nr:T9SS type A sorting domain-containing protein [Bacteroidales bacterium]